MIEAEQFFQKGESKYQEYVETSCGRIQFRWYTHSKIQPLLDRNQPAIIDAVPGCMPYQIVSQVVPQLLAQDDTLINTVSSLAQEKGQEITGINAMQIQAGNKAYIVLCEVKTTKEKQHFVMYVSRNPKDSTLGNEAERDFHNLIDLNTEAERRLTDEGKKRCSVIRPIQYNVSPIINGHKYGWFTMPFVPDHGELTVFLYEDSSLGLRSLYFSYALAYNAMMDDFNMKADRDVLSISQAYRQFAKKFPIDRVLYMLSSIPYREKLRNQLEDLLIGNALIYLLSDRHFPKGFMVNAGDWMVDFSSNGRMRNLCLITVREGWEYLGSDEAWIRKMQDHLEQAPGKEFEDLSMMPIFYGNTDLIAIALVKAKKLIKP